MNVYRNRLIACMVCLLLACASCVQPVHAAATYEGPGWETPEAVVQFYLEGLKAQDLDALISAYAVETLVDGYDLQAQLTRLAMYSASLAPRFPNTNALVRDINIEARRHEIIQSVTWQISAICMPETDFMQPIGFSGDDRAEKAQDFVAEMDRALNSVDFSTLELIRFNSPEEITDLYASQRNQENIRAQIAPYGADEARSVVALFTVDGKVGVFCCDTVRYADKWYMFRANGNIGALIGFSAAGGGMVALDADELLDMRDDMDAEWQALLEHFDTR